jgi:hypothetical protein
MHRPRTLLIGLVSLGASACTRSMAIQYRDGACVVDGARLGLGQVEDLLLRATQRAAELQRWFLLVTIVIVGLALASHGDKVAFLFTRRGEGPRLGLGDRVRAALERHRAHPVRYFTLVSATLVLLGVAAGFYVHLDADKRQNDRALQQLQFCHLALKSEAEQRSLVEQRHNLDALQQTAGDIRSLVDGLPPAEQEKAKEIVGKINVALGKQSQLVGAFAAAQEERGAALAKDVSSIQNGVVGLQGLPQSMKELQDAAKRTDQKLDQKMGAVADRLNALDQKIGGLDPKLGVLDEKLSVLDQKLGTIDKKLAPDRADKKAPEKAEKAERKPPDGGAK